MDAETTSTVDATLQIGLTEMVVVTASKLEEEVMNAPATVSVISEQMIQALPSQNFADLLRAVPGMNVIQTSATGISVTSRSATATYPGAQLALIDGRTLYLDYLGSVHWDLATANLDEVKQVEVIRGSASAVWGAYAMNGVVNIITKPPREMLGTTLTFGIGTFDRSGGGAESNTGSLYYVNAAHAQALNDRWAFKIASGAYTQDAFARPQGTMPNAFHMPYPEFTNEGTTRPKVDARVDYDLPEGKHHFTFSGGYVSSDGIVHGGLGPMTCNRCITTYGKADYVRGALKITGFVNTMDWKGETPLFLSYGEPVQWRAKTQTYDVELGNSHMVRTRYLISYGGNFRHTEINASTAPTARSRNEGGVYSQDEITFAKHFRWVVGARVDKAGNLKGAVFSPRTTFMVKPVPNQTFRVSYNRAYVAPSIFVNYLQSASGYQLDLGLFDPQLAGNYFIFPVLSRGNRDLKETSLNA